MRAGQHKGCLIEHTAHAGTQRGTHAFSHGVRDIPHVEAAENQGLFFFILHKECTRKQGRLLAPGTVMPHAVALHGIAPWRNIDFFFSPSGVIHGISLRHWPTGTVNDHAGG